MAWFEGLLRVAVLNLVPLWGWGHEGWSPGTTLALYWLQTVVAIPVTAALVVMHRRVTRKAGHWQGISVTRDSDGRMVTRRGTYLHNFLFMAVPFTMAHGVFLAFLLGLLWKDEAGAVDYEDLRTGLVATLNVMAVGFAFEVFGLGSRSFAWIENRATGVLRRMALVHFVIIFGLGAAVFADKTTDTFFAVFIGMKVFFEILGELPEWNPPEASPWVARIMNRIGGPGSDFAGDWKRDWQESIAARRLAEETIESIDAKGKAP